MQARIILDLEPPLLVNVLSFARLRIRERRRDFRKKYGLVSYAGELEKILPRSRDYLIH